MPSGVTAGDLVKGALRLVGAIGTSEVPTADEFQDGLAALNDLMEIWSTQNLAVWGSQDVTFNTVAATAAYTIGPTGVWVTDRPVRINAAPYCTVGGVDFPIELLGQGDYDLIGLKTQTGQIVERMLFVNDSPNGRLTLWPVPTAIIPITLNIDRVLATVANVATVLAFPPGYLLAMRYALGIMLAPDYGRPVTDDVSRVAQTSFAAIKRANQVRRTAKFDAALTGGEGPVSWQRGY
jgi:hypothetical protein